MQLQPTLHKYFKETCFVLKIPNNYVQATPQLSPQWISLTTLSHTPTTRATSPAATRTTPLRWRLVARETAVRGNAQLLGPRSVHPGSVPMTLEPVILSSQAKMMWKKKVGGQLQHYPHINLISAPTPSTSAELGSIRSVVTIQNA